MLCVELDRQRRPARQAFERSSEAAVAQHGRMDAARQLAQLAERQVELGAGPFEQRVGRGRVASRSCRARCRIVSASDTSRC